MRSTLGTLSAVMSPVAPLPAGRLRPAPTLLLTALTAALVAGGALLGYRLAERTGETQLVAVANERLALYAATLEAELARFAYLPSLVATQTEVQALLARPDDPALRQQASRTLARVGVRAGASEVLLLSADHTVLARSDGQPSADATLPPLLAAALRSGTPEFFAVDPPLASTRYHFVHELQQGGVVRGRVLVGISLAPLEATWVDLGLRSQSERLLVVDEQGRVVLSSVPGWRYRRFNPPLDAVDAPQDAPALRLPVLRAIEPGVDLVQAPAIDGAPAARYIAQAQPIVPLAVRLVALSDPAALQRNAQTAAWGGAAGGALVSLLLLYLLHRRRALRQLFQARNALQQAHDQLERQVDERTAELRRANEELTRQIAQREQAEDELLQAGKLAVLGQMSAGISHEINQPLTALRALSSNALRLLAHGRTEVVADNLKAIDEMADRMGRIIQQLKSFARKDVLSFGPVALDTALHNVLLMLSHRLQAEPVELQLLVPEGLQVRAELNRLEQVLLNLLGNALDAVAGRQVRRLRVCARPQGPRVHIEVDDSGPGLDDAQMARLFEPFFTTKPAGQGLGLGLVISAKIVREFGGTLRAERLADGLRLTFDLEGVESVDV